MSLGMFSLPNDSRFALIPSFALRTILSSSGNDGRVRLWKQTVGGVWRPAGQISVEQDDPQSRNPSGGDLEMEDDSGAD